MGRRPSISGNPRRWRGTIDVVGRLQLSSREQQLILDLDQVLAGTTRAEDLSARAYPLLAGLVSADLGALCSFRPQVGDYEWSGDLPPEWFATYTEIAEHDFVRKAVSKAPNVALWDARMIGPREKERSHLYQRTRHLSLEHALSILLTQDGRPLVQSQRWHGGVTLYRTGRRPFSSREADILQMLATPLAMALQRCQSMGSIAATGTLEAWLAHCAGLQAIVLDRDLRELGRTNGATELLARWYPDAKIRGTLPEKRLSRITADLPMGERGDFLERRSDTGMVLVGWVSKRPPAVPGAEWVIVLIERSGRVRAPERWRALLSPREFEVSELVLNSLSNAAIAEELELAESTVKQHVKAVFDKLGVSSRAQLGYLAHLEGSGLDAERAAGR